MRIDVRRYANARRLDHVDGVDANARADLAQRGGLVHGDVDRDDGGHDAAIAGDDSGAVPAGTADGGRRLFLRVDADWRTCRSEEHTSELQSLAYLVCRLLLEKKKQKHNK